MALTAPEPLVCGQTYCRAPGPYRTVPDLAAHRYASHGIALLETYADHGYQIADDPMTPRPPPTEKPAKKPAKKPENRMRLMAKGVCARCQVAHGPKPCPKRETAPTPPRAASKTGTPTRRATPTGFTKDRLVVKTVERFVPTTPCRVRVVLRGLVVEATSWEDLDAVLGRYGDPA